MPDIQELVNAYSYASAQRGDILNQIDNLKHQLEDLQSQLNDKGREQRKLQAKITELRNAGVPMPESEAPPESVDDTPALELQND